MGNFGLIEVVGLEAQAYLQARTTNDVLTLGDGGGQPTCLLERKGHLLAYFSLHKLGKRYFLLAEIEQIPVILAQLEFYHFSEKVEYRDISGAGRFLTVQGPQAISLLADNCAGAVSHLLEPYAVSDTTFGGAPVRVFNRSLTGEEGFVLFAADSQFPVLSDVLTDKALSSGFVPLAKEAMNVLRIEAGIPLMNVDMSEANLLPETGLDLTCVSYTKGCYIGQEVLARIHSQGAPKRGLVGLVFGQDKNLSIPCHAPLTIDGVEIGQCKSSTYSPTLKKYIAFAYVTRDYRVPDKELVLQIAGQDYVAQVVALPFYRAGRSADQVREIYDQALTIFAGGDENQAVSLLRQVIKLEPLFADAYEALGVMLARHDQLDEAITLMQKLAELDATSIMAHTNLSVFYMQKGWKEKAEDEKALALTVRMDLLSKQMTAEKVAVEEKQKKVQEATKRMAMFEQVLEIDAEDLLANYGLGSCLVELEKFSQAVPYLQKAIAIKPDYTVAYLALGEAYRGLQQFSQAKVIYNQGIAVAAKRGDLMPMQQMQSLLHKLPAD